MIDQFLWLVKMAGHRGPPIDEEISEFINKLWTLDDKDRCRNGVHYEINKQGWAKFAGSKDNARQPLFTWLDVSKVACKKTFKTFYALLDNYIMQTGEQEVVTKAEVTENRVFIDSIMETAIMQEAYEFLKQHGKVKGSMRDFKHQLYDIWFKLYRRTKGDRDFDSSGFEHVFVGEVKDTADGQDDEVTGFHNWLQIYLQEKKGVLDYMGYYSRGTDDDSEDPRLITVKFRLRQDEEPNEEDLAVKPKGSSFLGTTPEFEIAVYTVCYLMNRGPKIGVKLGDNTVVITVHRMGPYLGSAYPIVS